MRGDEGKFRAAERLQRVGVDMDTLAAQLLAATRAAGAAAQAAADGARERQEQLQLLLAGVEGDSAQATEAARAEEAQLAAAASAAAADGGNEGRAAGNSSARLVLVLEHKVRVSLGMHVNHLASHPTACAAWYRAHHN
jgi:methyl-accepting chemotaxis protein